MPSSNGDEPDSPRKRNATNPFLNAPGPSSDEDHRDLDPGLKRAELLGPSKCTDDDLSPILILREKNARLPAVDIPPEIMSLLFETACFITSYLFYVPLSEDHSWDRCLKKTRCAIASTCHAWRQVALATTGLWNNIYLRHFHSSEAIELYGQRAGSRPLGLYLDSPDWGHITPDSVVGPLLPHCRLLSMRVCGGRGVSDPLASAGLLPNLLTLAIGLERNYDTEYKGPHRILLRVPDLPALRALSVSRHSYTIPVEIQHPMSLGVTTLRLSGFVDATSASKLVEACTRLEVLHWVCKEAVAGNPRHLHPLVLTRPLHSLLHFSFNEDGYDSIKSILGSLQAPNLTTLQLVDFRDGYQDAYEWQQGLEVRNHPFSDVKRFPRLRTLDFQVLNWSHDPHYAREDPDEPDLATVMNTCLAPFIAAHIELEVVRLGVYGPNPTIVDILGALPRLRDVWWKERHLEDDDATPALIKELLQSRSTYSFPCVVHMSDPSSYNCFNPYHAATHYLDNNGELVTKSYTGPRIGDQRPGDPLWTLFWDPV